MYQYFLPFLSRDEETRLVQGMCYFLRSYVAAASDDAPWKESEQIIKQLTTSLKKILSEFRGVEALYQVEAKAENAEDQGKKGTDSRTIENIQMLSCNDGKSKMVNILFVSDEARS